MKFNVVCISMAIGLLASSTQAAPIVSNVGKVVQDAVGVDAPLADTQSFALKLTNDVSGDVAGLGKRQASDPLGLGDSVGLVTALGLGDDVSGLLPELKKRQAGVDGLGSTVEGVTKLAGEALNGVGLGKRSPLLNNQGNDSTGASGALLGKREDIGDLDTVVNDLISDVDLDSALGGVTEGGALGKRDALDGFLPGLTDKVGGVTSGVGLKRREGVTGGLTGPVTSTVSGLKLGETVGSVADVNKLVANVPVDTSSVTGLVGMKRSDKKSNDDDKPKEEANKPKNADNKPKKDDDQTSEDSGKTEAGSEQTGGDADPSDATTGEAN